MLTYIIIGIIIIIVVCIMYYCLDRSNIVIFGEDDESYSHYNELLKSFEKKMEQYYPLGDDSFRISHGDDYCMFFKRIGEMYMILYLHDNLIVATGCAILRNDSRGDRCFYICDVKVDPKFRGQRIPFKMLCNASYLAIHTTRAYAVSMNDGDIVDPNDNKVVRLTSHLKIKNNHGLKYNGRILIYSLDYQDMCTAMSLIKRLKGNCFYVELNGIKDLVLKSNNQRMKLLHLNFEKNIDKVRDIHSLSKYRKPLKGYTHMFCLHEKDPLVDELMLKGIETNITASLLENGMDDLTPVDWDFIQTSEI